MFYVYAASTYCVFFEALHKQIPKVGLLSHVQIFDLELLFDTS